MKAARKVLGIGIGCAALLLGCSSGRVGPQDADLSAPADEDMGTPGKDLAGADLTGGELTPDLRPNPDLSGPATGDPLWAKSFGAGGGDYGYGVAADRAGNVLVTGEFSGSVDFGGGALPSAGASDAFLARYTAAGVHVWSKRFGSNTSDSGRRVAADADGNVIVAGVFSGAVDFGGGPITSAGGLDVFLAKYTPAGAHVWSKRFGGVGDDSPRGLAIGGTGEITLGGVFSGTIDLGGGGLMSAGAEDAFLARFGADGAHRWSKRFGASGSDEINGVAVDGTGNVLATGAFSGNVDFGGGALSSSNGSTDIFVGRYGGDGGFLWAKRYGNSSTERGQAVAADTAGNALVTGTFGDVVDFGAGPLNGSGSYDVFVAKLAAADGSHRWAIRGGGIDTDYGLAIAADPADNALVAGTFIGHADFGGGPLDSSGGSADIFIAKYGPTGSHLWSRRLGGTAVENVGAVAVDPGGNLLCAGSFAGTGDFGGGALMSAGSLDAVLFKRAP